MLVGQTIRGIIYGEMKCCVDEDENNVYPEPSYKTQFADIDTLDYSIYFRTDDKAIYIFWDSTFCPYGLLSELIDLTDLTNNYEQKWDVSEDDKWQDVIGQKIMTFNILWEETWTSNLDGSNKIYMIYPQAFVIETDNGKNIIISAAEFTRGQRQEVYPLSDNLLVTTNIEIAKKLQIIE